MHALSLQASQVADIFHFCAYKVIIIILVGVTEQGSIHCNCQPPINIPLLRGNPRSSRDLQFTQLRSMWTKPSILSLSLFFLPLLSPFPCSLFSYHITARPATVCFLFSFSASYLLSPAFLPHEFLHPSAYLRWPPTLLLTRGPSPPLLPRFVCVCVCLSVRFWGGFLDGVQPGIMEPREREKKGDNDPRWTSSQPVHLCSPLSIPLTQTQVWWRHQTGPPHVHIRAPPSRMGQTGQ